MTTDTKRTEIAELIADIRNKLCPFWNMIEIVNTCIKLDLKNEAKLAEENKETILGNFKKIIELTN